MSTTLVISALIAFVAIAVAGFTALKSMRKGRSRTPHMRPARLNETANSSSLKQPETGLDRRETAEDFHHPFSSAEHARYAEVHAQYVEAPGGTVTEADPGLSDVLSMSSFLLNEEQCGADVVIRSSPLIGERVIHEIAVHKRPGMSGAEELRRALNRYRALIDTPRAARRHAA